MVVTSSCYDRVWLPVVGIARWLQSGLSLVHTEATYVVKGWLVASFEIELDTLLLVCYNKCAFAPNRR